MNILIINQYAVPPNASGGNRHFYLARNLKERGHKAIIVAGNFIHQSRTQYHPDYSDVEDEKINGVEFRWLPAITYGENGLKRMLGMVLFAIRVVTMSRKRFSNNKPEIVIGSSPNLFAALAAWLLAKRIGSRFVLEIRDIWPETLVQMGVSFWNPLVILFKLIEKLLYRKADKIITLLPGFAKYLELNFSGKYLDKVVVIPNGVDAGIEEPSDIIYSEKYVITYAGSFGVANALECLIDVADRIQGVRFDKKVEFRFIGDGACRSKLEDMVIQRGLKNVIFEGSIPKQDIIPELRKADILIATLKDLPLYRWGISLNKIYDYMLAGRPVIFGANSLNNPILDAKSGIVIRPEDVDAMFDAICELLSKTAKERHTMGINGYNYVMSHYLWSVQATKFEEEIL